MEAPEAPGRVPLMQRRISSRTLRAFGVVFLLAAVVGSVVLSLTLYTLSRDLPSPARALWMALLVSK